MSILSASSHTTLPKDLLLKWVTQLHYLQQHRKRPISDGLIEGAEKTPWLFQADLCDPLADLKGNSILVKETI